ncbi:MAG: Gfo/Idh/MocA family oxidoreductase [Lentisphaeria bacterium]|nr:Gfo/Idh/MocA family oxidoreductase [Lentisphaeria bacterium]
MKRFCIVGTGGRGTASYAEPILKEFPGRIEIVGLYDINPLRCEACKQILKRPDIPVFTDFKAMLDTVQPDGVIVTTKDCTHAEYVLECLKRNIAVYSEKPLCTTRKQCMDIRRAAARSSAPAYVTHNMRFGPDMAKFKELLQNGAIGKVLHIQFTETLDRFHGADYFRRWHRLYDNTGSLLIHKASHHFDLINWFADSRVKTVTGQGALSFYGRKGAFRGKRCSTCAYAGDCEFYADVFASEHNRILYREAEKADHYYRDGCVFDRKIDIPDTYAATMAFENGIIGSYSLIAYASYESMHIAVEGSEGRLEYIKRYGTSWAVGHKNSNKEVSLANDGEDLDDSRTFFMLTEMGKKMERIPEVQVTGGHGGADPALREALFCGSGADPLGQRAPMEEGIQAVLVGISVMDSIRAGGKLVNVQTGKML